MRPKIESVFIYIYTVYIPKFAMLIGQNTGVQLLFASFMGLPNSAEKPPNVLDGGSRTSQIIATSPNYPGPRPALSKCPFWPTILMGKAWVVLGYWRSQQYEI